MDIDISLTHTQPSATCPYLESDQSSPCPHTPLPDDPSQYYPPIYALVFQVVSFPQVSQRKSCTDLSSHPYLLHASPISFDHPNNFWWEMQIMKLLVVYSSSLPYFLAPLTPNYILQHPLLELSQPTFLPQCERPRFTPIQNNRQSYNPVYLNLYIFG